MSAPGHARLPLGERERAVMRVCFDRAPADQDLRALGAPDRWLLYRTMVRDRLIAMIRAGLPRTEAAIGPEALETSFAGWLAEAPPRSRYIRDVVAAFVAFASPAWGSIRPFAPDLGRYEALVWQVRIAEAPPVPTAEFDFDHVPVLNPTLALARFDYAVNERREDYPRSPVILLMYRRLADHKPFVLPVDALTADLVKAWQEAPRTVTEGVRSVAETHGVAIDGAFIDRLTTRLADFISRGLILGSQPG